MADRETLVNHAPRIIGLVWSAFGWRLWNKEDDLAEDENTTIRYVPASDFDRLKAKVEELAAALERDRSNVITACNEFSDAFARRSWLLASRGPYEWDDDRYRDEFQGAYDELAAPILKLQKIGKDWSLCPTDPEAIRQARINWKERAEATEAKVADLSARLARAVEVKALEWDTAREDFADGSGSRECSAALPELFSFYTIYHDARDGTYTISNPHWVVRGDPIQTLESAKAAAQADFEQRIRSALVLSEQENRDACA